MASDFEARPPDFFGKSGVKSWREECLREIAPIRLRGDLVRFHAPDVLAELRGGNLKLAMRRASSPQACLHWQRLTPMTYFLFQYEN